MAVQAPGLLHENDMGDEVHLQRMRGYRHLDSCFRRSDMMRLFLCMKRANSLLGGRDRFRSKITARMAIQAPGLLLPQE